MTMAASYWGDKMASVVSSCGPRQHHPGIPYHRRLEKVKFGVCLDQVCKRDIPGPLLVMLLKLNKEGPFKKDVFRAPGHQANMQKLIHFLQQGRLVNIHSFSVNTVASVLKKFFRKIPGGIFGAENEKQLFKIIKETDTEIKLNQVQRLLLSLPLYSQHLLVLIYGTFRVIHTNCITSKTGMTAEALGVSVAPSFFHTCVAAGKTAKMEDVEKFKLATHVATFLILNFGIRNLFGRENYEYYAKLTGRILRVEDEWIFFTYPPVMVCSDEEENRVLNISSHSGANNGSKDSTGSLEVISENWPLDPQGRLSISLEDRRNVSSHPNSLLRHGGYGFSTLDEYPSNENSDLSICATKGSDFSDIKTSYTCLPQVHERQTERMKHRSEWFLSDPSGLVTFKCSTPNVHFPSFSLPKIPAYPRVDGSVTITNKPILTKDKTLLQHGQHPYLSPYVTKVLSASPKDSTAGPIMSQACASLRRRLSDKDKERRLVRRSSSKRKNKENGGGSSTSLSGRGSPALDNAIVAHAVLCRSGSQDTPRKTCAMDATLSSGRSLPRI